MTHYMTEEQIELAVERKIDRLDQRYIEGEVSHEEYQAAYAEISCWAERQAGAR